MLTFTSNSGCASNHRSSIAGNRAESAAPPHHAKAAFATPLVTLRITGVPHPGDRGTVSCSSDRADNIPSSSPRTTSVRRATALPPQTASSPPTHACVAVRAGPWHAAADAPRRSRPRRYDGTGLGCKWLPHTPLFFPGASVPFFSCAPERCTGGDECTSFSMAALVSLAVPAVFPSPSSSRASDSASNRAANVRRIGTPLPSAVTTSISASSSGGGIASPRKPSTYPDISRLICSAVRTLTVVPSQARSDSTDPPKASWMHKRCNQSSSTYEFSPAGNPNAASSGDHSIACPSRLP